MWLDRKDWKDWLNKLKWHFISFKFLSFYTIIALLIFAWKSLIYLHNQSIEVTKVLFKEGYINQAAVSDMIKHSYSVLFDSAASHILVSSSMILSAIIAIKGVSYVMNSKQTSEVVKKLDNGQIKNNYERFLPKHKNE